MFAVLAALTALVALSGLGPAAGDDEGFGDVMVELAMAPSEQPVVPTPVVDRLGGGDVLDIKVVDGTAGANGAVRQCVRTLDGVHECTNGYPVRFDDRGGARFQYQLTDPGNCGPGESCVLVVDDLHGQRRALAVLVFGAPAAPPPVVTIAPAELVEQGDQVRVNVTGLQPDSPVQVGFCDPQCTTATELIADALGRVTATITVGAPCPRCGIAVIAATHETLTPVPFAPPPRADYDARRLTTGLLVAAALLVTAWRITAAIDWRPPSEADTPDLDLVEL